MDFSVILVQLLIIGAFIFHQKILERFPESFKKMFTFFISDMKFELGNKWKTLVIPIIVMIFAYIACIMYYNRFFSAFTPVSINDPLFILDSVILAPTSEQILQGFLLTALFVLISHYYKNKWEVGIFCFIALMLSSYIMAEGHLNPTPLNWLIRFLLFMIYGAFYYLNDRNLLPAIVAHTSWNIILFNQIPF